MTWMGQHTRTRINLSTNESPIPPGSATIEAVQRAIRAGHRYPTGRDVEDLQKLIGEQHGVDAVQVAIGAGLTELLASVARAFAGPGTEVLAPEHSFVLYRMVTQMVGADERTAPLDGYRCDLKQLSAAVGPKTSLVFVANPNNPTGLSVPPEAIVGFVETVPRRVTVVIDEAYGDFSTHLFLPKPAELLRRFPNLIIARTLSKAWGLAGLRLGYVLVGSSAVEPLGRQLLPFRVSTLAIEASKAALQDTARLQRVVELNQDVREHYCALFRRVGIEYWPSDANFVTMLPGWDTARLLAALREAQIDVCHLGPTYGLDEAVRVSTGTLEDASAFADCLLRHRATSTARPPQEASGA